MATFIGMYLLSPKLYGELRDLLSGRVALKYIGLSAISEGLTILGFYLASIAYGLFSQVNLTLTLPPTPTLTPTLTLTLTLPLTRRPSCTRRKPACRSC